MGSLEHSMLKQFLVTGIVLLLILVAWGVHIAAEIYATKEYAPDEVRRSIVITSGSLDAGDSPALGALGSAIDGLATGTTFVKWSWPACAGETIDQCIPNDLCDGAQCAITGDYICGLKGWEVGGNTKRQGVCLFDCVDEADKTAQITIGIVCP